MGIETNKGTVFHREVVLSWVSRGGREGYEARFRPQLVDEAGNVVSELQPVTVMLTADEAETLAGFAYSVLERATADLAQQQLESVRALSMLDLALNPPTTPAE